MRQCFSNENIKASIVFECDKINFVQFRNKTRNTLLYKKRFFCDNFQLQHILSIIQFLNCFLNAGNNLEVENTIIFSLNAIEVRDLGH